MVLDVVLDEGGNEVVAVVVALMEAQRERDTLVLAGLQKQSTVVNPMANSG